MTIEEFDKLKKIVEQIKKLRDCIDSFEKGTCVDCIKTIQRNTTYSGNIIENVLVISVDGRDKLKNAILDCLKEELQEMEQQLEKANMGEE